MKALDLARRVLREPPAPPPAEPVGWQATREQPWPDDPAPPLAAGRVLGPSLGLALVYGALAMLSLYLGRQPGAISVIWFANAPAVAFLLFRPVVHWPAHLLALALANLLANRLWGDAWPAATAFVLPNLVEILAGAWLLRRAGMQRSMLRGPQALLRLWLLGALLPQGLGATLGAVLLGMLAGAPFGLTWLHWVQGSAIGAVSMLPLAFVVLRLPPAQLRAQLATLPVAAFVLLGCGMTLLVLAHVPFPFVYAAMPLTIAAMVVPFAGVALATLAVSFTIALALSMGVFVPPPVAAEWEQVFVYVAFAAALVPSQLLAAALAEMRDSNARLAHRSGALRRANESLEQFVRIASHDLREPLNTVVQFSGLIEEDAQVQLTPAARQYLGLVRGAAARMRTLLDDVLQYTRVQGGTLDDPQPVPLDAVLTEVRQSLAGRLHEGGGVLRASPLPVVRGHAALLQLLLQNLVGNALKFVPSGRRPEVDVSARVEGGHAWITVADNGIGIAERDLPKLFRPFQRLNLRRHYEGSGLGLALCRQVALLHGGEIVVASVPGEGSRFSVRLPLA